MKTRRVILELSPSRIDVARLDGGQVVSARRLPITLPSDGDAWPAALGDHVTALKEIVTEIGATGLRAEVLYRSPTQSIQLKSLPVKPSEALEAARLSCYDSLTYPIESAICSAVHVASEGSDKAAQSHVVVAVDRDDAVAAIESLVTEAGLRFRAASPVDAITITGQVRAALADTKIQGGRLYIGEHSSFFLATSGGRLVFARQMRIGLDTIASSLTYPIKRRGAEAIQLDAEAARRLLQKHGMPGRDAVVDEVLGLSGGQIVPLMQPVLQRLIIELRQSMRFGLSDEQRGDIKLLLTGPGGVLPGLGTLIGDELGVPVEVDETYRSHDWTQAASDGSQMHDASRDGRLLIQFGLLPEAMDRQRSTRRLCKWMWTGATAALLMIAVDAARVRLALDDARSQINAIETQLSGQELLRESSGRLTAATNAMKKLDLLIASHVGFRPHYGAILKEISLTTPRNIRLTGIALNFREGVSVGQISGVAVSEGGPGTAGLQQFIDTLRQSPLIKEVALGNVQMGLFGDKTGERFEANFVCPVAPADVGPTETMAAVPEDAS